MQKNGTLTLTLRRTARSAFNTLLQRGFYLTGRSGMTVREFLRRVVGWDDARIDGEVRTIFLNASPLDGLDDTRLQDGDKLALGSAMPGLVGICLGRDNPYKGFRSSIDMERREDDFRDAPIRVFVKVFSVLAVDTGEALLARGVEVEREPLLALLMEHADSVVPENGRDAPRVLRALREAGGPVRLVVRFV